MKKPPARDRAGGETVEASGYVGHLNKIEREDRIAEVRDTERRELEARSAGR